MSRSRSLTALLLLALGLGFAATGLVATSAAAAAEPKIWGVVLDGKGKPVLDVVVTAVDENSRTAASDLSYEGGTADDSPRQGYFELMVGSNGTYTVTLKKSGFVTEKVSGIKIASGQRVQGLGDITLLRVSKTSGDLVKSTVSTGDKGKVEVAVTPAGEKPTGKVAVKEGKQVVGSATLKGKHNGEVTVTLEKLAKGSHDLKVVYGGSGVHAASTSAKFTLKVTKPKQKRQSPNALTYLG